MSRGSKGVDDIECVTDETLHHYSIQDMVLPLPGYDIMYPKNEGENAEADLVEAHSCHCWIQTRSQ